jgi:hypothetical protein
MSLFEFPITLLGGSLLELQRWWFFTSFVTGGVFPGPLGEVIPPGTNGQFDPEEGKSG